MPSLSRISPRAAAAAGEARQDLLARHVPRNGLALPRAAQITESGSAHSSTCSTKPAASMTIMSSGIAVPSGALEPIARQLLVQGRARDAEQARRFAAVAVGHLQRRHDQSALVRV